MGICSSNHRYPSCNRYSSYLMTKMVMGARWRCGIDNKCNNSTLSTPRNNFHGSKVITAPLISYFIKFLVTRCRNFSLSMRSQSSNFMVGMQPRCVPSNTIPSGRCRIWSELLISSRSFTTLAHPFHGGTYVGYFVAECNGWVLTPISSSSPVAVIKAYKSSSSSSISNLTAFPFSSMDSFLCRGFLRDMHTGPITYLSFLVLGVHGDFRISVTTPAPSGRPSTIWVCTAS